MEMMESEAIARIKASRDYRYSHYAYVDDTGKAFDMAIRALEKQGSEKRKSERSMRIEAEKLIKEQPTVYDVDKVVEKLESEKKVISCVDNEFQRGAKNGHNCALNMAIEIVKRGGANER